MKSSDLLRLAREHVAALPLDRNGFICNALSRVAERHGDWDAPNKARDLRALILKRLGHSATYEGWLFVNRSRLPANVRRSLGNGLIDWDKPAVLQGIRSGRLAWLDSLIAEHEAKGD